MVDSQSISPEAELARFVARHDRRDVPVDALDTVKNIVLAVAGTSVAGAGEDGVDELRAMLLEQGGKPEATVLVYGDRLPAANAALLNSVMARALDYCDAMVPGAHFGSSVFPVALAASEIAGDVSGDEFLSALTVGFEVGSRLNVSESAYGGRDPTGVPGMFAATATAARLLGLNETQTLHALALAFNRCAGSVQSNVDASLAVRLIQGWVSEASINCARLAKRGFTGPIHFLDGVFGYSRIFARGERSGKDFIDGLGEHFALQQTMFKRYPSCGLTQGATDLALQIRREAAVGPDSLRSAQIHLPAFSSRIVGGPFRLGNSPRVNAQFSARFCVANAWARGSSKLSHFTSEALGAPEVMQLIDRIEVIEDPQLDDKHQTAVRLVVRTSEGDFERSLEISPGFPPNKLLPNEHLDHFNDCMQYASLPLSEVQAAKIPTMIASLEEIHDIQILLKTMTGRNA